MTTRSENDGDEAQGLGCLTEALILLALCLIVAALCLEWLPL